MGPIDSRIVRGAFSVLAALFLRYLMPLDWRGEYSAGIWPVMVAVAVYFVSAPAQRRWHDAGTKERIVTTLLGLMFSVFLVLGSYYNADTSIDYANPLLYLAILVDSAVIVSLLMVLWRMLDNFNPVQGGLRRGKWFWVAVGVALLICWLPTWLAMWPGSNSYDGANQWVMFSSGQISTHHTVLHTLLFGAIVQLGQQLFGQFNAGIALFIGLQLIVLSVAVTLMLRYLAQRGCPIWLLVLSFLYFTVNPVLTPLLLNTTKDILFSVSCVLFAILLSYLSKPDSPRRLLLCVALGLAVFMFIALRSSAIYILVIFLPFVFLLATKIRMRMLFIPLVVGLVLFQVLVGVGLTNLFSVEDSSRAPLDAISIPRQQLARTWLYGDLSAEEKEAFVAMFSQEDLAIISSFYKPDHADPPLDRGAFYTLYSRGKGAFILFYLQEGLRHPGIYLEALMLTDLEAIYPGAVVDGYLNTGSARYGPQAETALYYPGVEGEATPDSKIPWLHDVIYDISLKLVLQKIPLLGLLASPAFYAWILLIAAARVFITKEQTMLLPCVLILLTTVFAMLSPLVVMRYYLPLLMTFPLLVWFLLSASTKSPQQDE